MSHSTLTVWIEILVVERDERPLLPDAHRKDQRPMVIAPVLDVEQLGVPGAHQRAQPPVLVRFHEEVLREVVLRIGVEQHLPLVGDHGKPEAGDDAPGRSGRAKEC